MYQWSVLEVVMVEQSRVDPKIKLKCCDLDTDLVFDSFDSFDKNLKTWIAQVKKVFPSRAVISLGIG